jgi:signal transduction histidine kinase
MFDYGQSAVFATIVKAPWNSIFFRKPLLAFLAAFAPMALIAALILCYSLAIRLKNRTISEARKRLQLALAELEATQEKLVEAEKYRQARDIAGGFAHEIRNALFPARATLAKLLRAGKSSGADVKMIDQAKLINRAVAKAVDITKLISDYTKLGSRFNPEPVNLADVVDEVISAHEGETRELGVSVSAAGDSSVLVEVNRDQLYIVVSNLLRNSLDALTETVEPAIVITWRLDDDSATITFNDNGCGIGTDDQARIFEAFFSTKPESGTGIGLAMSRKIVRMYGGEIEFNSKPGAGTTFTIRLPGARTGGRLK